MEIYIITTHDVDEPLRVRAKEAGAVDIFSGRGTDAEKIIHLIAQQQGKRVALVEDNPDAVDASRSYVQKNGALGALEVVVYSNPIIAATEIPRHAPQFDVVISDLDMQRKNGLELTKELFNRQEK